MREMNPRAFLLFSTIVCSSVCAYEWVNEWPRLDRPWRHLKLNCLFALTRSKSSESRASLRRCVCVQSYVWPSTWTSRLFSSPKLSANPCDHVVSELDRLQSINQSIEIAMLTHFSSFPCSSSSRSNKTFKPKKHIPEGTHQYDLMKHAAATLGSGDLRLAVKLPEGEDLNEWVAVNTVDFFNQINMLYGTVTEFCSELSCPVMSAGPRYEYHWADGQTVKKPIKCSAPKYIDYLMTWVQDQLDDETLFPAKIGKQICFLFNRTTIRNWQASFFSPPTTRHSVSDQLYAFR